MTLLADALRISLRPAYVKPEVSLEERKMKHAEAVRAFLDFARMLYGVYFSIQSSMGNSRDTQRVIAKSIASLLKSQQLDLRIPVSISLKYVGFPPGSDVRTAPTEKDGIPWAFMNEDIASCFPRLAHIAYGSSIKLFHHVPKTGGTSLAAALVSTEHSLLHYETRTFEFMCDAYGTLALPYLVEALQTHKSNEIIVSGHYALSDYVIDSKLPSSTVGITLFAPPNAIIDSGIRYYMTRISEGIADPGFEATDTELANKATKFLRSGVPPTSNEDTLVLAAIKNVISQSGFTSWLSRPLKRWYLGRHITNAASLDQFLTKYANIRPFEEPSAEATRYLVGKEVIIPHLNESSFPRQSIENVIGVDQYEQLLNTITDQEDEKLYQVLRKHKEAPAPSSEKHPPRTRRSPRRVLKRRK